MKSPNILTMDQNKILKKQKITLKIKYKNKKFVNLKIKLASVFLKIYQKILGCKIKIEFDKDFIDD